MCPGVRKTSPSDCDALAWIGQLIRIKETKVLEKADFMLIGTSDPSMQGSAKFVPTK